MLGYFSPEAQIKRAIRRGVKALDEECPNWRDYVDTRTIDLASYERCVLGQVYGSYNVGLRRLCLNGGRRYGFTPVIGSLQLQYDEWWSHVRAARPVGRV